MKSFLPALAAVSVLGFASLNASAADGSFIINGTVTASTCSINGTANGTAYSKNITLPTVAATALSSAGATAGPSQASDIQINLTGCSAQTTKAVATWENGAAVDQATGNLVNQASTGAAGNVEVQLLNAAMQPIDIRSNTNNTLANNGVTVTGGNTTAPLQYYAQYIANGGAASAGAVKATAAFTMSYQ
ncbi:fimbrial protein [Paraburkholderia aspalathi]|uniref:fimbrial protein n=1 Tax=Paraburkholderia aspalathi TaxID=1324617 RepID=UPI0038B9AE78